MPAEAQNRANQANARRSAVPPTPPGQQQASPAGPPNRGATGGGAAVVMSEADAAEVVSRYREFEAELKPASAVELTLVHRMAISSVRMNRGVAHEVATLAGRLRQAEDDFVAPEGTPVQQLAKLRAEASARALFDPSQEATLARRYEAAAERSFYRAFKELRLLQKPAKGLDAKAEEEILRQELGSFLTANAAHDEFIAKYEKYLDEAPMPADLMPKRGKSAPFPPPFPTAGGAFDVPFAIGKPR